MAPKEICFVSSMFFPKTSLEALCLAFYEFVPDFRPHPQPVPEVYEQHRHRLQIPRRLQCSCIQRVKPDVPAELHDSLFGFCIVTSHKKRELLVAHSACALVRREHGVERFHETGYRQLFLELLSG